MDVGLQCCGWGSKSHVETTCGAIDAMEGWRSSAMGDVLAKAAAVPTGSWFSGSRLGSFPTTNGSFSTTTNRREPAFPCHQVLSLELCATWHVPEGP